MARAIAARLQGDDYQARWFWIQACNLFIPRTRVSRVAYEADEIKSFDDVVTFYDDGKRDESGNPLRADLYQVKFHVAGGSFAGVDLIDPAFINATSISLLQRLRSAQEQLAPDGVGCRLILFTPWWARPDDLLAGLISQKDGRLLWPKLSQGGPRSKTGRLRKQWRDHLGLDTDEELATTLRPLRIRLGGKSDELQETLNDRLELAGLVPVSDGVLVNPYDELIRKLLQAGRTSFTRDEIASICSTEGLWRGRVQPLPDAVQIGVRSFRRWTEALVDETEDMLDLVPFFDGRRIAAPGLWAEKVHPAVREFLASRLRRGRAYHLHLHAHTAIAVATGYELDSKAGIDAVPVQSTAAGQLVWCPTPRPARADEPALVFADEPTATGGHEVAVGVSVTHDLRGDVRDYVEQLLPGVGRMIWASMSPAPSATAVIDGAHARDLAQQLRDHLRASRAADERRATLHFFIAAPNGLAFFLGQLLRALGPCVLYEYDLEGNTPGGYAPSLSFPPGVPQKA